MINDYAVLVIDIIISKHDTFIYGHHDKCIEAYTKYVIKRIYNYLDSHTSAGMMEPANPVEIT